MMMMLRRAEIMMSRMTVLKRIMEKDTVAEHEMEEMMLRKRRWRMMKLRRMT